jgi:RNA recognition motif-containing protein
MTAPVGEDAWLAAIQAAGKPEDTDQRVELLELYRNATTEEPYSMRLWIAYCDFVWSLHQQSHSQESGWSEEDQMIGQEIFGFETAQQAWQQGAEATKYRINDSHKLWNRWISVELERLGNSSDAVEIHRLRELFEERLQVPHLAWDETSQLYSTFISKHFEAGWEETMVRITLLAKTAKELCAQRVDHERTLEKSASAGIEAEWEATRNYLDWEVIQSRKKGGSRTLCVALYERALVKFGTLYPDLWEDYYAQIEALGKLPIQNNTPHISETPLPDPLFVLGRASTHCPWSGSLWALNIIRAEVEGNSYEVIENLKNTALRGGLGRDGSMEPVLQVYSAWCGYLRRLLSDDSEERHFELSIKGIPTALQDAQKWGEKIVGKKAYKGDPQYRLEQIYIQHLSDRGLLEEARNQWKKLVKPYGDSYEFWQRYYLWEMVIESAKDSAKDYDTAADILKQAINRRTLDWPEKLIETLLNHAGLYTTASDLHTAILFARRSSKGVTKRREKEAAEMAAAYAQQQSLQEIAKPDAAVELSPSSDSKRKREEDDVEGGASKKSRAEDTVTEVPSGETAAIESQNLKRDRENTSVLVTNLPPDVTQTKVRQFFKGYGHINNLSVKAEADGISSTALIEFRSTDDVESALIRDGKYLGDSQVHVTRGTGLTLYVTNYPPTADETYLRDLFKDCGEIFNIRWPSLKFNTHRRFCYISFRSAEAAAAATRLDGKLLDGRFKLLAKYSDPSNKKSREGPVSEGREIHISSLDRNATEEELKEVLAKYGNVESVRILKTLAGKSKGAAFAVFSKKEEATAALALNNTKFKSGILLVDLSTASNFKPTATNTDKAASASPAPDADGDIQMTPAAKAEQTNTHALHGPSRAEISAREIAIINVPDTVNDARIRALASTYGTITKLVLRPDHQGALIEFSDVAAAGRASLGLEGYEIEAGRKLKTGGRKDLFAEKGEYRTDRILSKKEEDARKKTMGAFMQPAVPIRRPGGRGGLGTKRGLGFARAAATAGGSEKADKEDGEEQKGKPKSNADFKAMFLAGGKSS